MATTSTEAIPNTNHQSYRLGHNLINKVRDKIWNGDIVATASTTGFWEPDKEFKIKVKVNELKRKFHQNRYLQIKHLPRDVSEEEIRQMLSDFPISSVILSCGHGSAGSAKAYLEDPEMLEDWDKDRTFLLRGQKIPVSPTLTEMVLCVARYPMKYNESHFSGLVSSYGEVKTCFLMISEKTGESKGYGFVEYATKEAALHAKSKLDGLQMNDATLCADFIDGTHITFESLHSKCLYVDNLPLNYRDMGEFRRLFSKVVNPPYCQIALKNGCPQNWGLVEFNSGEDAENTQAQLNGCELKGKNLRISYYIPGVRAINLYLKLLNETDNNRGKGNGLLPTPPPGVFQSFKNLQKQNPVFAQSIQNIMVTEQQLGVGNTPGNNLNCEDGQNGKMGSRKKPGNNNKTSGNSTPDNESPVNDLPFEQQAALLRILACQVQNPALLQSPQMAGILKQFKGNLNGASAHLLPQGTTLASLENSGLALPPGLQGVVPTIPVIPTLNGLTTTDLTGRGIFVDAVKPSPGSLNLLGVNSNVDQTANGAAPSFPSPGGENPPGSTRPAAGLAQLWNSPEANDKPPLSAEENLLGPHLPFAGQINPFAQRAGLGLAALMPGVYPLTRSIPPIPGLQPGMMNPLIAAEPPQRTVPQTPPGGFHPGWFAQAGVLESPQFSLIPPPDSNLGNLLNQNALLQCLGDNPQLQGLVNESLNQYLSLAAKQQNANFINKMNQHQNEKHLNGQDDGPAAKKMSLHPSPTLNNNIYRSNSNGSSCSSKLSDSQNSIESDNADYNQTKPHPSALPMPIWSNTNRPPPKPIGYEAKWNKSNGSIQSTPPPNIPYPPPWNSNPFSSPSPSAMSTSSIGTPVGQKRKYNNFLPSPEPSPEGNYIGQHSQGIGGHYPDSWSKRKKKY